MPPAIQTIFRPASDSAASPALISSHPPNCDHPRKNVCSSSYGPRVVLSASLFVHKKGSAEGKIDSWLASLSLSLSLPPLSLSPSLFLSLSFLSHLPRLSLARTQSHTHVRTLTRTRTLVSFPTVSTSLLFFPRFSRARFLFFFFPRVFYPFPRLPGHARNQAYPNSSIISCQARSQAQAAHLG